MKKILSFLRHPLLDNLDVDGLSRFELHQQMLEGKKMLQLVFSEFHRIFKKLDIFYLNGSGIEVELGAGVSPMRISYPEVLATDIVMAPNLDRVINAESMNFADNSVRVLYGQNCFHHFPDPDLFFSEAERVLSPGGGIILLEPYYGPAASFLYKRLFSSEGFDKAYSSWKTPITGPMNGANQALSYIVFIRDKDEFSRKYPNLKIVNQSLVGNYLKYLISGGLNFKQLLPNGFIPFINITEKIISPFNRWLALHHIVVIQKLK